MDEYTVRINEIAPAFIDIEKVTISIDGGIIWTNITEVEGGTVYVKAGIVPIYRVLVRNTGGVPTPGSVEYPWHVSLYELIDTTRTYITSEDITEPIDPGLTKTVELSPSAGVVRGRMYEFAAGEDSIGYNWFGFTIAELAFMDILQDQITPTEPQVQGTDFTLSVPVKNTGDIIANVDTHLYSITTKDGLHFTPVTPSNWKGVSIGPGVTTYFHVALSDIPEIGSMPNGWIAFDLRTIPAGHDPIFKSELIWDSILHTIFEALEGAFKDASLQVCDPSKCETAISRGGTVTFTPSSKTPTITVKNTGGIAQPLTITLYDELGVTAPGYPVQTDRDIQPGEEVVVILPSFTYPGGSKTYKWRVDP